MVIVGKAARRSPKLSDPLYTPMLTSLNAFRILLPPMQEARKNLSTTVLPGFPVGDDPQRSIINRITWFCSPTVMRRK